ncbi:long-chain fatty acid--CoA ligase [Bacteroidia bacterium]|nr:long-chain fatty acid--CoA ligase [Bacteroidia bacterium]
MRKNPYPVERDFKSLHHFFINAATQIHNPEKAYMWRKVDGKYQSISYGEVLQSINCLAAWFIEKGLQHGDKVAICLENCPEYIMADQALIKIGCANASIYPTLSPDETAYIINDSASKIILLGSPFLFKKFKKIQEQCKGIEQVILRFDYQDNEPNCINIQNAIKEGEALLDKHMATIEERFAKVGPDDLATLIYTSGTTGVPKGVMLTHWNFGSNCFDALELCPAINSSDRFLSFLPLSHVYERMATYYLGTYIGGEVAFAESIEKVAQNVKEMQPTILACVPRLLERIEEKVRKTAAGGSPIKAKIFNWAFKVGEKYRIKKSAQKNIGPLLKLQHSIAHKLVFSKIHESLGGKMRLFVSGGAALPKHVGEFYGNIGLRVQEGYGLTETSPFVTVNEYHHQIYGSAGRVGPRQTVAIQNADTKEFITQQTYQSYDPNFSSEEGEILVKGPNIMIGYYNKPEATAEVFDEDDWFHTGDVGKFHRGYLHITDRIKNMFVNSLGKNIYPTPVENTYLKSDRIEQLFLIGDKREYITAIIVPNEDQLITDLEVSKSFFKEEALMVDDENVRKWMNEDVKKYGLKLAKFERIKDFVIKRIPFSVEENEITPTLKPKRKNIEAKYGDFIEGMYS